MLNQFVRMIGLRLQGYYITRSSIHVAQGASIITLRKREIAAVKMKGSGVVVRLNSGERHVLDLPALKKTRLPAAIAEALHENRKNKTLWAGAQNEIGPYTDGLVKAHRHTRLILVAAISLGAVLGFILFWILDLSLPRF